VKLGRSTGQPPLPLRHTASCREPCAPRSLHPPLVWWIQTLFKPTTTTSPRFFPATCKLPPSHFLPLQCLKPLPHLTPKASCPPWSRDRHFCAWIDTSTTAKPPSVVWAGRTESALGWTDPCSPPQSFCPTRVAGRQWPLASLGLEMGLTLFSLCFKFLISLFL
jgi:hypothetical protein